MKKLFIGASMALMLIASSCSKNNAVADGSYNVDKNLSDSISVAYGKMVGSYVLADYMRFSESNHKGQQMKEDIIKGLRIALANADSEGTMIGLQIGASMLQQIKGYEEQGVNIDKATVLKNFIAYFSNDSIDNEAMRQLNQDLDAMINRVNQLNTQREEAEAAEAPDAKQNEAAAKEYIEKLKAADADVKTTASGLSYKITAAGDDTQISDNTLVTVNYVGRFIDGTVFDQSDENQPATFSPAGVIPGFSEGLKLLGKGAKATLYIPGELAYGVNGVPQANIGPNQMLIFDVEIVDVQNNE